MAREKPPILRLRDLVPGDQPVDFFALLSERVRGTTRDSKPFYTCRFRDAGRTASSVVWSNSPRFEECEQEWKEGHFFKIRASYHEDERYGHVLDIANIRQATDADRVDGFEPGELVDHSRFDAAAMLLELRGLIEEQIRDAPLRRLVLTLLERNASQLKSVPATQGKFYPFAGGLLEHTLSVTKSCLLLADRYVEYYKQLKPSLNRDLLLAAAALHDLGRAVEFEDELGLHVSVPGRMFGHLMLGRDLVREAAREQGDVNAELVRMLEHLIVSHLALPEWGSPRLPLIPEALILHHADDLDAKLEMYVRCLVRDQATGPFTERDPVLGKALLKGREV
jgi:3'-5' exoribonuclease